MRIAIDARIINSTTGTYCLELIKGLEALDKINQYFIIVPSKDKSYLELTNPNFKIITADFPNYSLSEQIAFKKFLDSLQVDLVHFCMPQQPLLYEGKTVTTFHDLTLLKTYNSDKNYFIYHFKQLIGKFVFKSAFKKSNAIIVPSNYTKNDLISYFKFDDSKINVIYEAASKLNITGLQPVDLPFKQYLLYVGNQSDYKNIKALAKAHQELLSKYPNLGLVLVGSLNQAALINQEYFTKHNYKNIYFTGFLSNQKRDYLYKNALCYVFPSLMEGFGLPGLEAMNYGLPVVSSNATCLPEIYGEAACYFNPNNIGSIVKAIDKVVSSPNYQQQLISLGYQQVKKYSWNETAKQTLSVYQSVLKK